VLSGKLAPVQRQWMAALDELSQRPKPNAAAVLAGVQAARRNTLLGMLAAGALALAVGAAAVGVVVRGITRRLRTMPWPCHAAHRRR
jgi:hypothetical protein